MFFALSAPDEGLTLKLPPFGLAFGYALHLKTLGLSVRSALWREPEPKANEGGEAGAGRPPRQRRCHQTVTNFLRHCHQTVMFLW